ncbi:MAG: glycine cleavage T C-terminal barrel domain-containing protein, partial [Pseudomonadota bacterium]
GLEALGILRIEKGHVTHAEINGRQTAEDLGLGGMVSTKKDFVGSSMLDRQGLKRDNREQLVGLLSEDSIQIKSGSHLVVESRPVEPTKSHGWVTSNAFSPELDQYIALALLENGRERIGETLYATDPLRGRHVKVQVVSPHFVDPDGGRMHA